MATKLASYLTFSSINLGQGLFYMATGLWPIVSMSSFQRVSGPKTDLWLVKTVGILISVIGAVLVRASQRKEHAPEVSLLAIGSAVGLAGIDTIYVAKKRIWPIYLLDAVVEIALAGLQVFVWRRSRHIY